MPVRVVEGKRPYTGGKAITVDENKVISLNLRAENNLIIYDEGDDEIYVDLQLRDGITPMSAFPVGVTTGRVAMEDGWDADGTIVVFKTTSGDNIKLFYSDNVDEGGVITEPGKLYIDNGTGTFKQIYFKSDVDSVIAILQQQIDALTGLGKFLSSWDASTGEPVSFPLSTPYTYTTGDWYLVGIADQTTNYRPAGDEWVDDDPSATRELETNIVEVGDVYIYDGIVWILQKNTLAAGSGDVNGPASSTDGDVAIFDGTTGKLIKDGSVALSTLSAGASAGATAVQPGDIGTAAACNTGTSSGNVPILDSNGKLNKSTLPGVALTDTYTVSTSSDLTSLSSAEQGDLAIATSENKTYVLASEPYSTAANWKEILAPTGGVTSVNTQTGAVTLDADDISDSTTTNKFVTATDKSAWSGKQDALTLPATPTQGHLVTWGASNKTFVDGGTPVVSGDSGTIYTIKVSNSDPGSGTPATTITFVV